MPRPKNNSEKSVTFYLRIDSEIYDIIKNIAEKRRVKIIQVIREYLSLAKILQTDGWGVYKSSKLEHRLFLMHANVFRDLVKQLDLSVPQATELKMKIIENVLNTLNEIFQIYEIEKVEEKLEFFAMYGLLRFQITQIPKSKKTMVMIDDAIIMDRWALKLILNSIFKQELKLIQESENRLIFEIPSG